MSGRGSNWLLAKVRDAGVKVIIDLRTADHTDRYDRNVAEAGLEYHNLPVDSRYTDVHQIIGSLPLLFELMDNGGFYIACAIYVYDQIFLRFFLFKLQEVRLRRTWFCA